MGKQSEVFTVSSAARFLEVSVVTLRSYADEGRLPVVRTVSGVRLFTRADLEAFRLAREQASTKKARR